MYDGMLILVSFNMKIFFENIFLEFLKLLRHPNIIISNQKFGDLDIFIVDSIPRPRSYLPSRQKGAVS